MKQKHYNAGLIMVTIILVLMSMSSCSRYAYGKGCEGNKKMLGAGAGYTKFRK